MAYESVNVVMRLQCGSLPQENNTQMYPSHCFTLVQARNDILSLLKPTVRGQWLPPLLNILKVWDSDTGNPDRRKVYVGFLSPSWQKYGGSNFD
jgi:hypothetical protein